MFSYVTPAFDRLTDGGWPSLLWGFFCVCSLAKLFFLSTRATIASQPLWPFNFFTISLPADATGAEHGLVRYFSLSAAFTAPINSARVQAHLLYPVLFRAFTFHM
jgi:hypothetical protein